MGELQRHCRVCGGRLNKAKGKVQPIYSCFDYPEDLKALQGSIGRVKKMAAHSLANSVTSAM